MPTQAREAGEVAVVRVNDRAVFKSDGSYHRIWEKVGSGMTLVGDVFEQVPVLVPRMQNANLRQRKPFVNDSQGICEGNDLAGDDRIRKKPDKRMQRG